MTIPKPTVTELMRMALAETGRPDMAAALTANSVDSPAIGFLVREWPDDESVEVAGRAAWLAHHHAHTPDFWVGSSLADYLEALRDHPWRGEFRSGSGLWGCPR